MLKYVVHMKTSQYVLSCIQFYSILHVEPISHIVKKKLEIVMRIIIIILSSNSSPMCIIRQKKRHTKSDEQPTPGHEWSNMF